MFKELGSSSFPRFLSLDLSTTSCGYVYFYFCYEQKKILTEYGYVDISKKDKFYDKTVFLDEKLNFYFNSINFVVLENYLLYFSAGKSNAKTITNLVFFSGYFESFLKFFYKKDVYRVSHVSALYRTIKNYRRKMSKDVSIFGDYSYDKGLSVSKVLAFNYMCENIDYKPFFKDEKKKFLSKYNFDIADAFVNGVFYLYSIRNEEKSKKIKKGKLS